MNDIINLKLPGMKPELQEEAVRRHPLPRRTRTVSISADLNRRIEGYLTAADEDHFQGEDETISVTADFSGGIQMDIKCCGCRDDSSWTEAVLFHNGSEVACSEVSDEFLGTWKLEYDGCLYAALVQVQDETGPEGEG